MSVMYYGKHKLNGGSTIRTVKAKTTLVRTGEVTVLRASLGRTHVIQNPHPGRHYRTCRASLGN